MTDTSDAAASVLARARKCDNAEDLLALAPTAWNAGEAVYFGNLVRTRALGVDEYAAAVGAALCGQSALPMRTETHVAEAINMLWHPWVTSCVLEAPVAALPLLDATHPLPLGARAVFLLACFASGCVALRARVRTQWLPRVAAVSGGDALLQNVQGNPRCWDVLLRDAVTHAMDDAVGTFRAVVVITVHQTVPEQE